MENEKIRYGVERNNIFVRLTAIFLGLAAVLRLSGSWGFWKKDSSYAYMQLLLPILCCLIFILILLFCGKKLFFLTAVPALCGTVFFIVRAVDAGGVLRTVLCVAACLVVLLLYCATVFGIVRTKWLLPPVFGLAVAYKLFLDKAAIFGSLPFKELLSELSVLFILLAMLLLPFGMKKRDPHEKSPEEQVTIDAILEHETPLEGETDTPDEFDETDESEAESHE